MTHITIDAADGAAVSTLCNFPAKLTLIAGFELPGYWVRDQMKGSVMRAVERVASGATVLGGAVGGAFLMNYLAPGGVSAGFGLVAGGAFGSIAVVIYKLAEMKLAGAGVDLQMKLETIAKDATEAKKLAQLTTEIAFDIGNRPRGVIGGGLLSQNDRIRRLIAERLQELGLNKRDASKVAHFDDPHIARRIIQSMILNAVRTAPAAGEDKVTALSLSLLGVGGERTPEGIEAILGAELMADAKVKAATQFYRQWYNSEAKLYFVVDNLGRLHAAEQQEKSIVS